MDAPLRILLLEDNNYDAEIIQRELKRAGLEFSVLRVLTQAEFEKGLTSFQPDIVLSDYSLPSFNAAEALKILQTLQPHIPFIIVTGTISEEVAVDSIKSGAWDYVLKDRIGRLGTAVLQSLERKRILEEQEKSKSDLAESEERYRLLLNSAPDAIFLADTETGIIVDCNAEAERLIGLPRSRIIGMQQWQLHPEEHRDRYRQLFHAATQLTQPMRITDGEVFAWNRSGVAVPVEISSNVITLRSKKYIQGIFRDITERRKAQAELEQRTTELNHFFTLAIDLLCIADMEGRFRRLNDAWTKILGYPRAEMENQPFIGFVHPDDVKSTLAAMEKLNRGEEIIDFTNRYRCKDGTYRWIEWRAVPHEDKLIYAAARDVTDWMNTTAELRRLHRAIEQSPASIIITDTNGNIEYVNPKFTEVSGYTLQEVKGKTPRVLKSGQTGDATYRQLWETILAGNTWNGELLNRRKNGELYWELVSISPVRDVQGSITHFVGVKEDITEKRAIEERLLRSQRLESLGVLAGGIAHDLNNVLAPVMLSLDILRGNLKEERDLRLLDTAGKSLQRGKDIVRQVLSFARGMQGEMVPIQPKHIIREIEDLLKETFPRSIRIMVDVDKDLSTIVGDTTQIHQLMMNLAVNSRDAMPKGGVLTIEAANLTPDDKFRKLHPESVAPSYVKISVRDTGRGIPPDKLKIVFDPFFTTKEPGKGTGLGLSTVHSIAKSHDGWVEIDSVLGKGTTVTVFIPATSAPEQPRPLPEPITVKGAGELILLVDDETAVRELGKLTLEDAGFRVIVAEDGIQGLSAYAKQPDAISLVISDVMMPNMDGAAMAQAIRHIKSHAKIIGISGIMEIDEQVALMKNYANATLNKPFNASSLLNTVKKVLQTS